MSNQTALPQINSADLYDYVSDPAAFSDLLLKNPGLIVEASPYCGRNIMHLIPAAYAVENIDMIYWLMEQDSVIPEVLRPSLFTTLLIHCSKLESPEQSGAIHRDILNRYEEDFFKPDENGAQHSVGHRAWNLLSPFYDITIKSESAPHPIILDNLSTFLAGNMSLDFIDILKQSIQNETDPSVMPQSKRAADRYLISPHELGRILRFIKPELRDDAMLKLWEHCASNALTAHCKYLIDIGVNPFEDGYELRSLKGLENPGAEELEAIAEIEHYAFSNDRKAAADNDNVTERTDRDVGNLII